MQTSGNWRTAGSVRGAAIGIAIASIKMSVGSLDDALKLGEHLASWRSATGRRQRRCGRIVRSQVRLSAPRHRSVKPGPAGHRRWRLRADRRREAARSAHAINVGMSMTAPMTRAVIARSAAAPESRSPGIIQVGLATHFAAAETRSVTGPVPDLLEDPLPPSTVGAHPRAGKKVRISTGVHISRRSSRSRTSA